ncbi:MAG: DUF1501 domain-containing protein [Fuerstiella sp.]|nr:DUF1501 domain-containing protein [Fuerstiella sp.]
MLRLTTSGQRFCDGIRRRDWLRLGALSPLALNVQSLLAQRAEPSTAANRSTLFGRAKQCVILWMGGGPAQQDTFDLKPDAPAEYRSAFRPIETSAPGIQICEHFPHLAKQMDRIALVRSVTHSDNNHSTAAHWMSTGYAHRISQENFIASRRDHPHIGSVVASLRSERSALPNYVNLPERSHNDNGALTPGQDAGFLGGQFDPFWIEGHPHETNFEVPSLKLDDRVSQARLRERSSLLKMLNVDQPDLAWTQDVAGTDLFFDQALGLLNSKEAHHAFDLRQENDATRRRYGDWAFGQSLLLTRRLVEAGIPLVTVSWPRHRTDRIFKHWDTHSDGFNVLKKQLIPWADRPVAVFLEELNQRRLLDETLVVWMSEFGRSPTGQHSGHWAPVNTIWFAGAGIEGGQVYGASDNVAAYPAENPVTPADVTATIFHLLGIPVRTEIRDAIDRPFPVSQGKVIGIV